jgi:hypothetical protein
MNPRKGIPKPRVKNLYSDPFDQVRHRPFIVSQCQARFRYEEWQLTFEEFCTLWTPSRWAMRGRGPNDLVLVRDNPDLPWRMDNVSVITRSEQLSRQRRTGTGRYIKEKQHGTLNQTS